MQKHNVWARKDITGETFIFMWDNDPKSINELRKVLLRMSQDRLSGLSAFDAERCIELAELGQGE